MNMRGKKPARAWLAGLMLLLSATVHAESISEQELLPQDALDLSIEETKQALRYVDGTPDFALYHEAWDAEMADANRARPDRNRRSICGSCEFHLGVGGTYHSFDGTGGVVIPMTVSWDRNRWEFGVFRFGEQSSDDNDAGVDRVVARPYWGASLSRRFAFYERGPLRAVFGFGVSYRTEQDILSATHWNFSSQLGLRFQSPGFPVVFELSARHWSNGGVRTPNRGQDFTILTMRFDH